MNMVLIQHPDNPSDRYCFEVPERLLPYVKRGASVVCHTRRGKASGIVVSDVISNEEDILREMNEHGAKAPLRKIASVVDNVDISGVSVPIWMSVTTPRKFKLDKRIKEMQETGCFHTNVVIENGVLKDGYTAYLVAKRANMMTMPVMRT